MTKDLVHPPKKWRGTCHGHNFTCNNKIIGARYYRASGSFKENDIISPRDSNGHGTHTASIAAGGLVSSASLFGLGAGTARGGVPLARIAVYKPFWEGLISCDGADILAAFDDAIADGVDIISISAGQPAPDYFQDPIAIGAFHALRYGILTSTSAGNEGPALESLANFAPWLLSAAASTTDRKFFTKIQLGNRIIFEGVSINTFDLNGSFYPIIYGGDAPNVSGGFNGSSSRYCTNGTLDNNLIKGKIVLCESLEVTQLTSTSGATGLVIQNNSYLDSGFAYVLPASQIPTKDGESVLSYIRRTRFPSATIFKSNSVQHKQYSLHVPYFSSRGPNPVTHDILKPDISAPGVQILAAWSPTGSPSGYDDTIDKYNIT
ncbi:cucumisin-like [Quillaja saponaria]|uniref:Cucumisin-like n=1 Tax=Quillaja saponaria TaxID=32244 RepID=A0AAD7PRN9_QUISA|nr:cucumisin-like [Quillaja saponaria]